MISNWISRLRAIFLFSFSKWELSPHLCYMNSSFFLDIFDVPYLITLWSDTVIIYGFANFVKVIWYVNSCLNRYCLEILLEDHIQYHFALLLDHLSPQILWFTSLPSILIKNMDDSKNKNMETKWETKWEKTKYECNILLD